MIALRDIILIEPVASVCAPTHPNRHRFGGRLLLADRSIRFVEQVPRQFAAEHSFRYLGPPDNIATNPDVRFTVGPFLADAGQFSDELAPDASFLSCLSWGRCSRFEQRPLREPPSIVVTVILLGAPLTVSTQAFAVPPPA